MKAVVHIGTEKTGTTSIQEFLDRNRAALAARGFHVLESAGRPNHRWLPSYAMSGGRVDDFLRVRGAADPATRARLMQGFRRRFDTELRSLDEGVHTVLVSSEHLHSRLVRQAEVDAVGDLLEEYVDQVEVICYLRDQVELCESLYSTTLRVGAVHSLEEFAETCHPGNPFYDYAALLNRWANRFGRDALSVGLFDREQLHDGDLLDDYAARIDPGLLGALDKALPRANPSLSGRGQAVGRAVNRLLGGRHERLRLRALDLVGRRLPGPGARLDPATRQALRTSFRDINEAVRREWFPHLDSLFRP